VSWYQKGKTSLDFTEAIDSEWQRHQLGRVCISLQREPRQHPTTQFVTGRMPFLSPNQQHQSTEGKYYCYYYAAVNVPCVGHKDDESQADCGV